MASDSDLNSLTSSVYWWELGVYVSLAAVFIGVVVQSVHEFMPWFKHVSWWDRNGRRASALIIIAASAAVFVTTMEATSINDLAIAFLGDREAESRRHAALIEKDSATIRFNLENLQKQVGPRILNGKAFMEALKDGPKGKFEIIYGAEDQDSWILALQIGGAMKMAGWTEIRELAVPAADIVKRAIMLPQNTMVEVRSFDYNTEAPAMLSLSLGQPAEPRTLFVVVSAALSRGLVRPPSGAQDPTLPSDEVRITIFPH